MIAAFIIFYMFCALITFIAYTQAFETKNVYNIKRYKRILLRLSYLFFWPIYFIVPLIYLIYLIIKTFINKLFE